MVKQIIVGSDVTRTALLTKINDNFTELYNGKANLVGGNTFSENQTFRGNIFQDKTGSGWFNAFQWRRDGVGKHTLQVTDTNKLKFYDNGGGGVTFEGAGSFTINKDFYLGKNDLHFNRDGNGYIANKGTGGLWFQVNNRSKTPMKLESDGTIITRDFAHKGIRDIVDIRGNDYGPDWYNNNSTHSGFVERTTVGLPSNGEYWCLIETTKGWTSSSQNHRVYQRAFNGNKIFYRTNTDSTTWGAWKEVAIV